MSMDTHTRAGERPRSNTFPLKEYYIFDAKSSRFLDCYRDMFQPSVLGSSFRFKRDWLDSCVANRDDQNQEGTKKTESIFKDEKLSLERRNSVSDGYENREQDAKSRVLSCLRSSYDYVTPSTICYLRGGDSQLRFPFSVYKPSWENSFAVRSDQRPNGGISKEKFASTQSATGTLPASSEKQEKQMGNSNSDLSEKGNEFESENRRVEWSAGNSDAVKMGDEKARYRERRKRNNASAKKSRDARRVRELETQMKAAFLEKENMRLLAELMAVRQENVYLRRVLSAKV